MMNKENSGLKHNMTVLINEMINSGTAIGEKMKPINDIVSIAFNSFNSTLYIETKTKYILIEEVNGLLSFTTEFNKTEAQLKNIKH